VELLAWPGLRAIRFKSSVPLRLCRMPSSMAEDHDSLSILILQGAISAVSYVGGDAPFGAALILLAESAGRAASSAEYVSLIVPRSALRPLVSNLESVVMRFMPQDCEALRLLMRYLGILRQNAALRTPELRHLAVTHVYH
jgi:hypothetical protein